MTEIIKLMKKSCYARQDIIENVKRWAVIKNVMLIGSPFETDLRAVGDERLKITGASCTVDSDFFILGSDVLIDNLGFWNLLVNAILFDEKKNF